MGKEITTWEKIQEKGYDLNNRTIFWGEQGEQKKGVNGIMIPVVNWDHCGVIISYRVGRATFSVAFSKIFRLQNHKWVADTSGRGKEFCGIKKLTIFEESKDFTKDRISFLFGNQAEYQAAIMLHVKATGETYQRIDVTGS